MLAATEQLRLVAASTHKQHKPACRRASWAFVLQNMLGMCFMAFVLQTITLPSLRVASVFLVALFCYDVFMVFITPLFMPGGDSVMVRVATGGDMHEVWQPHKLCMPCDVLLHPQDVGVIAYDT